MPQKPPAFQFYAKDWLTSPTVTQMSFHRQGIFIRMLASSWCSDEPGCLPLPLEITARSTGLDIRSLRDFMAKSPRCWIEIDGKLVNEKLRNQYKELEQFHSKQSNAGKIGNIKRWGKPSQPDTSGDRSASASASATANKEHPPTPQGGIYVPTLTPEDIANGIKIINGKRFNPGVGRQIN